jgi:hypothetical protein
MTVAQTSIEAFHGVVLTKRQCQYQKILDAMEEGKDYSFTELFHLTGILPSTISGCINELRDEHKLVERGARRACAITGVSIVPHRLKPEVMVCA